VPRAERLASGGFAALSLRGGERLYVRALADGQAAELIAHRREDPRDRLSTLLTGLAENAYRPRVGMRFWSQDYSPLFRLEAQTHDRHDLMLEACNPWLNVALGAAKASCWDNFRTALADLGLEEKWIPYPLGLWRQAGEMNGRFKLLPSSSRDGDEVVLQAEDDVVVIVSACPLSAPSELGHVETLELAREVDE
jgi:uncharacterized protein YcgI (DUF1989 family)